MMEKEKSEGQNAKQNKNKSWRVLSSKQLQGFRVTLDINKNPSHINSNNLSLFDMIVPVKA